MQNNSDNATRRDQVIVTIIAKTLSFILIKF